MRISSILRAAVLLVLAAIWIIPLYLVLINSVVTPAEYRDKEPYEFPQSFSLWENITGAWDGANLGSSVGSTLFYATVGGILAVIVASLALGYRYGGLR